MGSTAQDCKCEMRGENYQKIRTSPTIGGKIVKEHECECKCLIRSNFQMTAMRVDTNRSIFGVRTQKRHHIGCKFAIIIICQMHRLEKDRRIEDSKIGERVRTRDSRWNLAPWMACVFCHGFCTVKSQAGMGGWSTEMGALGAMWCWPASGPLHRLLPHHALIFWSPCRALFAKISKIGTMDWSRPKIISQIASSRALASQQVDILYFYRNLQLLLSWNHSSFQLSFGGTFPLRHLVVSARNRRSPRPAPWIVSFPLISTPRPWYLISSCT